MPPVSPLLAPDVATGSEAELHQLPAYHQIGYKSFFNYRKQSLMFMKQTKTTSTSCFQTAKAIYQLTEIATKEKSN
jgi:hypothetical protein